MLYYMEPFLPTKVSINGSMHVAGNDTDFYWARTNLIEVIAFLYGYCFSRKNTSCNETFLQ